MSHAHPLILDTPEKVAAANALRERIGDDRAHVWRLGDHCWYDAGTVGRAIANKMLDNAELTLAVAP